MGHSLTAVHATGIEPTSAGFAGACGLRGWLRLPWDIVAMALGLLYWLVFGGLLTLVGGPLHAILPHRSGLRLGRFLLRHLFRIFVVYLRLARLVRVDSTALATLEESPGACIVAPNHTSLWDVVFLVARMPRAVCVMKESILKNPVLGGGARLAGYIANDSRTRLIRKSTDALAAGGQLLLFPEGTRTRRDARWINPFTGGCAIIAIRSGAPVLPVFIRSDSRYLEKGWPLWKRPSFPIRIRIETGEPHDRRCPANPRRNSPAGCRRFLKRNCPSPIRCAGEARMRIRDACRPARGRLGNHRRCPQSARSS